MNLNMAEATFNTGEAQNEHGPGLCAYFGGVSGSAQQSGTHAADAVPYGMWTPHTRDSKWSSGSVSS